MTNKYPGKCERCGVQVAAGTGEAIRTAAGWRVRHATACPVSSPDADPVTTSMTRDQAISRIADLTVKRWGESERAAAVESCRGRSLGALMLQIAAWDPARMDRALSREASKHLTRTDRRDLRDAAYLEAEISAITARPRRR